MNRKRISRTAMGLALIGACSIFAACTGEETPVATPASSIQGVNAAVVEDGTDLVGGRTLAEVFAEYAEYGIEYKEIPGSIGNVFYQGQAVQAFIDVKNDGSVFSLGSADGGDITVYTVYDEKGKLTGLATD